MKNFILLFALVFCSCAAPNSLKKQTDRERDGFTGKVSNVYVTTIYPSGARCARQSDSYDTDGRLIRHTIYTKGCGAENITTNYTFSADGKRTASTNATPVSTTTFVFDANGRLSDETSAFNDTEAVQVHYTYDSIGRIFEKTYSTNGAQYGSEIYEYSGEQKAPSKFSFTNTKENKSLTITYGNYEFNSQGDWIKREETDGGTNSYIERAVEYYKD